MNVKKREKESDKERDKYSAVKDQKTGAKRKRQKESVKEFNVPIYFFISRKKETNIDLQIVRRSSTKKKETDSFKEREGKMIVHNLSKQVFLRHLHYVISFISYFSN